MTNKIPFIPEEYLHNSIAGKKIWFSESEAEHVIVLLSGLVDRVFNDLQNTLNFYPKRAFVWALVRAASIQLVFRKLVEIGAKYNADEHCGIE